MREIELALQRCESQKQAVLDCSNNIIMLLDSDRKVVWANRYTETKWRKPQGMSCADIFGCDESSCPSCHVSACFEADESFDISLKTVVAGGEVRDTFYGLRCAPVKNNNEKISNVVVIAEDITEKLRLLKQLRHSSKMESIGTLAGGIAHDFNNILTPIMGYGELLRLDMAENNYDVDDHIAYVERILDAAKRAQNLVKQILVFSRSTEVNETLMMIHPVIKEGVKLIRATIPTTIEIKEQIAEDCGQVKVDPVEIHQILINLCKNAAEAIAGNLGEITITLRRVDGAQEVGNWLALTVTDNGCGIEEDKQERIFEPYYTTKQKSQGTGMGLSVVHGIISRYEGHIKVSSQVGHGTSITILLPVAEESINMETIVNISEYSGDGQHVLVIDDEKHVADTTAEMLTKLGYRVTSMTSVREAMLLFLENHENIDLVVTDLAMPHLTGVDLCQKMKDVRKDIPVLLFSGRLEEYDRIKAIQAGIDGFCLKPLTITEMAKNIYQLLN